MRGPRAGDPERQVVEASGPMNIFEQSGLKETFRRKHSLGWWVLLVLFVLMPIPWGPWWETIISFAVLILLAWLLFGRDKRAKVDAPKEDR
jgi:Flp pilus assembly protein TadB